MKDLTLKDWLAIIGFIVTLMGWFATYKITEYKVGIMEAKMERYDLGIMAERQKFYKTQLDRIESKVDKITEAID